MKALDIYKGFTLIEVLVAISIFSLIGVGSYTLLSTVIDTKEIISNQAKQLAELQITFTLLQRDLSQIVVRKSGNIDAHKVPVLGVRNESYFLEFARSGNANPFDVERGELMNVSYALESSEASNYLSLIRYTWPVTHMEVSSITQVDFRTRQVLSNHIKELSIRFMNNEKTWIGAWPGTNNKEELPIFSSLPKAIELTLMHERYGEMIQIFMIPQGLPVLKLQKSNEV